MTKRKYLALREKLYKLTGEIGTVAELHGEDMPQLEASYKEMDRAIEEIDALGIGMGYIDAETLTVIDKRFRKETA